ncbi:MAG: transposase [Burkholderiales bacterium]|nr:transposase [Opitutaceae bacterium]
MPDWVEDGAVYFITICCAERGANQLCVPAVADEIFEAVRFRQTRRDWHVHLLVLMPDHLHALISFGRDKAMKAVLANFKEIVAKKTAVRWQRDFFDHRLRSDESHDEKVAYIRRNPVRKGLVTVAVEWPYVCSMNNQPDAAGPAVPPYL